ncbi:MAG: hypothetical protein ACK480_06790, partial [Planctomycetota bacterium]
SFVNTNLRSGLARQLGADHDREESKQYFFSGGCKIHEARSGVRRAKVGMQDPGGDRLRKYSSIGKNPQIRQFNRPD